MLVRLMLALVLLTALPLVQAHKASDSYLTLTIAGARIEGRWDIALRDLDFAIGLDADDNGELTWGEVRSRRAAVFEYAQSRLSLADGPQPCPLRPAGYLIDRHTDGAYAVLRFAADCAPAPRRIRIDYRLLFDLDPQHRGLLHLENGPQSQTAVFSPAHPEQTFDLANAKPGAAFLQYLNEGVWHIWRGYDHMLFLLSLLLPAVLVRAPRAWLPAQAFRPVLLEVVKIVTAFTVAHSLTLSLAAFGVIDLPSRAVESAIAASVALAALNNVYPRVRQRLWWAAFGFGLIHGLGFANVLKDLGLPRDMLVPSLLAFNLGVEAGQLAIVSAFLPLAYYFRQTRGYRHVTLHAGSLLIFVIALVWLGERALGRSLIGWEKGLSRSAEAKAGR